MGFGLLAAVLLAQVTPATARVQAAYDAQCADIMHADWAALTNTFSPTFVMDQNGQTYSRDQVVSSVKQAIAHGLKFTGCTTSIDSVTQSNGVTIVVMRQTIDAAQGPHTLVIASGKRDMWTPQGTALVETSSLPLWATDSADGRIIQQSGNVPSPAPSLSPSPSPSP